MSTCAAGDCPREAKRRGYCWTHYDRATGRTRNGKPRNRRPLTEAIRPYGRAGWELLTAAATRYADQDAEASGAEFEKAKTYLRVARLRSARRAAKRTKKSASVQSPQTR